MPLDGKHPRSSHTAKYQGETFSFCSEKCQKKFEQDPPKYVGEKVSSAVRERVMHAMGELGYVRDGAARALASRHSLTIGNVVPTLGIGIFAAGVAALQRRLEEFGSQLLVAASDYDEAKEARQVRALIERGVDSIALVGQRHAPEIYQLLRSRKLPYVNTYQFDGQNPTGRAPLRYSRDACQCRSRL